MLLLIIYVINSDVFRFTFSIPKFTKCPEVKSQEGNYIEYKYLSVRYLSDDIDHVTEVCYLLNVANPLLTKPTQHPHELYQVSGTGNWLDELTALHCCVYTGHY